MANITTKRPVKNIEKRNETIFFIYYYFKNYLAKKAIEPGKNTHKKTPLLYLNKTKEFSLKKLN